MAVKSSWFPLESRCGHSHFVWCLCLDVQILTRVAVEGFPSCCCRLKLIMLIGKRTHGNKDLPTGRLWAIIFTKGKERQATARHPASGQESNVHSPESSQKTRTTRRRITYNKLKKFRNKGHRLKRNPGKRKLTYITWEAIKPSQLHSKQS